MSCNPGGERSTFSPVGRCRASVVGLVATVGVAVAVGWNPASARAGQQVACGKLLPPASGIYFGAAPAFSGPPHNLEGDTVTTDKIQQFDSDAGRSAIWSEFDQHTFEGFGFPREKVMTVWRAGKIPFVRLFMHAGSPVGNDNPPEQYPGIYSLQNIIDGKFDLELKAWADAARNSNIPILVEFGTEENAYWGPWAGIFNGGGETTGYGDPTFPDGPERFRDSYRHIVTLFRAEGATNVTWFFHMVQWFKPNYAWESFANYFPGDNYVDWLGLSTYGEGPLPDGSYMSFEQALQTYRDPDYPGNYGDITSISAKPLALVELGVPEIPQKPLWIRDMLTTLLSGRYPRLQAISWWNSADVNTWIESSPAAQQAFHDVAQNPLFNVGAQFSGDCRPRAPARVIVRHGILSWAAVPNAASYQIWRGSKLLRSTPSTSATVGRARGASFKVRGVNLIGFGPFASTTGVNR